MISRHQAIAYQILKDLRTRIRPPKDDQPAPESKDTSTGDTFGGGSTDTLEAKEGDTATALRG